jgi:hypothetical protein
MSKTVRLTWHPPWTPPRVIWASWCGLWVLLWTFYFAFISVPAGVYLALALIISSSVFITTKPAQPEVPTYGYQNLPEEPSQPPYPSYKSKD